MWAGTPAVAQVSVSIGVNMPTYPQLVRVPGYPVYYAPSARANYFFYDGLYWVFQNDNWYASSWYNGPWTAVGPQAVPLYILRVPVRYYRSPPQYFHGWRSEGPPRWGDHWGNQWAVEHRGWDHWDRRAVPAAAPLPVYQRQYSGSRYPQAQQQHELQAKSYRYQPHEPVVRQHFQQQAPLAAAAEARGRPALTAPPSQQQAQQPQRVQPHQPPQVQHQAAPPQPQQAPHAPVQREAAPRAAPQPAERGHAQPEHGKGREKNEGEGGRK
jgi:hypothetical protein